MWDFLFSSGVSQVHTFGPLCSQPHPLTYRRSDDSILWFHMVPLIGYREYLCSHSAGTFAVPVKITHTKENFFKRYTIFKKKKICFNKFGFSDTSAQFLLKFFTLHQLSSSSIDQSFFLISALFH